MELSIADGVATITLNKPLTLNALAPDDYNNLGNYLREVDQRDDVVVTLLQATGRYFCTGTDVRVRPPGENKTQREFFLAGAAPTTLDISRALYTHSKILVAALNGPALGIMAALLGQFDFIYALPSAWISTPFSFLGLTSEGGASSTFIDRLGISKAKEALLWGRKLTAAELHECGFINRLFPDSEAATFHQNVRAYLLEQLDGLDKGAILASKKLIQQALKDRSDPDGVNLRESYSQAQQIASGVPAERFARISRKEIKHKL